MKATGIVRKVDELGRIVLPIEMRASMGIKARDSIEIFVDGERIVLQKYSPSCVFCDNVDNVIYFNGKLVCTTCLNKLKKQY